MKKKTSFFPYPFPHYPKKTNTHKKKLWFKPSIQFFFKSINFWFLKYFIMVKLIVFIFTKKWLMFRKLSLLYEKSYIKDRFSHDNCFFILFDYFFILFEYPCLTMKIPNIICIWNLKNTQNVVITFLSFLFSSLSYFFLK